jgi:hypothetical protein
MMIAHDRLAHLDQICPVRQSVVSDGPARGCRAIDVTPLGGLAVRILPDRGLDVLDARVAGVPLHWVGPPGECPPLPVREGHRWLESFAGGLVTTCGLAHVGEPVPGHGLHGDASHLIASEVAVRREVLEDGAIAVVVGGLIRDRRFAGHDLELRRTLSLRTGEARLDLLDRTTNRGRTPVPAPILYHLNFGWPLVDDDTQVAIERRVGGRVLFGDPAALPGGWQRPGRLVEALVPVTFEHRLDGQGEGRARIARPSLGLAVEIGFGLDTLPRLFQWVDTRPGQGVVALEPANATTEAVETDPVMAALLPLAAGATRVTRLSIRARSMETLS